MDMTTFVYGYRKTDKLDIKVESYGIKLTVYRISKNIIKNASGQPPNIDALVLFMPELGQNEPIVLVNQKFLDLPKDCQMAILYHELGHVFFHYIGRQFSSTLDEEIEADNFSAENYNKQALKNALKITYELATKSNAPKEAIFQLEKRIEAQEK